MKTYVHEDQYQAKKDKYDAMGLPTDHLIPTDLNLGYVPMNVDYKSKESNKYLMKTHECNLDRFGLKKGGVS